MGPGSFTCRRNATLPLGRRIAPVAEPIVWASSGTIDVGKINFARWQFCRGTNRRLTTFQTSSTTDLPAAHKL
jgi:hypothetical protein